MSEERRPTAYQELLTALREAEVIGSIGGILAWDQETGMPSAAAPLRAEQISFIHGLAHERRTDERLGGLLDACEADPELRSDPDAGPNLREIRRDFDRATRLPTDLVRRFSETTTLAQHAWRSARERSDFAAFAPWLDRVLELSRERAARLVDSTGGSLYDSLLDEYEPGAREGEIEQVFSGLRDRLAPLIAEVAGAGERSTARAQVGTIPVHLQAELNSRVLARIGFDLGAGRIDTSTHPFCQGIGAGDTRLTTRYDPENFTDSLSSALHEGGHGLYEQGLEKAEYPGQPLSEAVSLGIHESQSRLWENQVGRSRGFWEWAIDEARGVCGVALDGITAEELYRHQNRVEPNLIRVESDEATYNLHIMLRFDLERALLSGDLPVRDLPAAWNDRMHEDLGLEVPDDRRGCLQDIHWSMGGIGYFPTYSLGNLYAAQLWAAMEDELPGLEEQVARGEFGGILAWLRSAVHRHGRRFTAAELCRRASGAPLTAEPLVSYLRGKLLPVYGL